MRLLYIVPYAPTPIRTRPYHLLQQLSRDGTEITLATLASNEMELDALARWRANGISVLAESLTPARTARNLAGALATTNPMQASYCWHPGLMKRIVQAITTSSYDLIQVEHLRGVRYGLGAIDTIHRLQKTTLIFWDSVDCITHLFEQTQHVSTQRTKRWITRFELERTRRFEARMTHQFAQTLIVSENERTAFCELPGALCERITVVPNGVALDYFHPTDQVRDPATILLTGKMSYHANVTAAFYLLDQVMPLVWQKIPEARVCIAGQNPPANLLARAHDRVEITGYVSDLRTVLNRATVACAPLLYGAGIQNKVLEAMASGLAVVASSQAVAALDARPEDQVLVGGTTEELSAQLVRVIQDDALRRQLETNGRRYVETHHAWSSSTDKLFKLYNRFLNPADAQTPH